jgi:hypothetical protein
MDWAALLFICFLPVSNGYSGANDGSTTNPAHVSNFNWLCEFNTAASLNGIQWVGCRVDLHVGTEHSVVSYGDWGTIEKHAVEIGVDIRSKVDIVTVINT